MMLEPTKLWADTTLFDIATPKQWKTITKKELLTQGFPVYGANGQIGYFNEYSHEYPTLMITCRGASCGNIHLSVPKSYINGNAMALDDLSSGVDLKYLYYFLRSYNFDSIISGSAQPQITQDGLKQLKIKLAPVNEQKRIADKLDSLLAKVDTAQKRLDKIPGIIKRFRQSVLSAATSGDLTSGYRGNKEANWPIKQLKDIANDFKYGSSQKSLKQGNVPVIRMGNIQNGELDLQDLVYSSNADEIEKYLLSTGDVLFNRTNSPELVGKTAIYRGQIKALYAGYLIKVRGGEDLDNDYLNYQLNSPHAREYCWRVKTDGVSQSNINAKKLRAYTFAVPPLEEQKEIVRRVDSLFALADSVEKQYLAAKKRLDKLTQSILAKAFRGELVSQDPNDEPASVLLEKIQQERAAQVKKVASRKKKNTTIKKDRRPAITYEDRPEQGTDAIEVLNATELIRRWLQLESIKGKLELVSGPLDLEKIQPMKLCNAPEDHLSKILSALKGESKAEILWKASAMSIDDFYAQLKKEMAAGLISEDNSSPDPELRLLKSVAS